MKNAVILSGALLFAASLAQASSTYSITVNDPFANGDTCNSTSCDVIGNGDQDRALFDIQKGTMTVSGSTVTMDLYFNYGTNNTNFNNFKDAGLTLSLGDLFFTVNGNLAYVAPLETHIGSYNGGPTGNVMQAGDLYSINNANGVLTAQQTLNDPTNDGLTYRRSNAVYGFDNGNGSVTTILNNGIETIVGGGDGDTNPEFHVTLSFNDAGALTFANASQNQSSFGFYFASATCGNDIISGNGAGITSNTPEPMSLGLVGAGLLSALVWGRRKRA